MRTLKRYLRVLLIVCIVEAAVIAVAGIVFWVISSRFSLYPPIGPFLLLAGLVQFVVCVWLYKKRGKGICGGGEAW